MDSFLLEVENWTEYEVVRDFSSLDRAKRYGRERFSQNSWRILDRGTIVFEHDPFETIQQEASKELTRFAENEKWRRIFAEKRADEIRHRQEQERLAERRLRQRAAQLEIDRQRRRVTDMLSDAWWDEQQALYNPAVEKVNWAKEGF